MAAMPSFTALIPMHSPSPSFPSRGPLPRTTAFYGPTVVRTAFVIALFGWGVGFYGPPVFLYAVVARTGWPLAGVSAAVTLHFLWGAAVVACLPWIHRRVGIAAATAGGAMALALGAWGWAVASQPWQLALAALLTGGGWVPLGAAGINAIVSPWFARQRPMALAKAYNGASVGGMLLSPLWVALIGAFGFAAATAMVGLAMLAVVLPLAWRVLPQTPAARGEGVDGEPGGAATAPAPVPLGGHAAPPAPRLWLDRAFITLAGAMALSLFAQIGLVAQLLSLLAPAMGAQAAGGMMALATGCGMAGRLVMARLLRPATDRRVAASAGYAVQALGTGALLLAAPGQWLLIVPGVVLFGLGIGNATSLPPLIAQAEFARDMVPRVVARCVALSQGLYAFAPAVLALLLVQGHAAVSLGVGTQTFFGAVLGIQALAIACMLAGRR